VNAELAAFCPPTVIENEPDEAFVGTRATTVVSLQLSLVAVVPFNERLLVPCVDPKPLPVSVTKLPTDPELGDTLVMIGVWAPAWPQ
jgi:hypothetical protein